MAADVEVVLTTWLRATFPGMRTCTELPADLAGVLPVVQVVTVGGAGSRFTDSPRVAIDVYAATYGAARSLALEIKDQLRFLRGPADPGAVVQSVRVDSEPANRPYENPAVRRMGSSYTVTLHDA